MFLVDLIASVIFAILASMLSVHMLRRSGYKMAFFWLFMLVLLATWAGGVWISPVGPDIGGIFLLPFVISGILIVLVLLAFTARGHKPQGRHETIALIEREKQKRDLQKITTISLNLFFYFLLILLVLAIVARYATNIGV